MKPEAMARRHIDALLVQAGWTVQEWPSFNLAASRGVAVSEFPLAGGTPDYLLFVDRKAVGVVEAKAEGHTLSGVSEQSAAYAASAPPQVPQVQQPLPFVYESTGIETFFRDLRDPDSRSRRVFAFHRPETMADWLSQPDTLRARLKAMPPLALEGLRDCQIEALQGLEGSLAHGRPRALIQMATGSGKTYAAVTSVYRLAKFAGAKRVLFLVDRGNLGRQTLREFQGYEAPDDGRKFTELYTVQRLTSSTLDAASKVCISTIQRLYSMLRGEEIDEELEEVSGFELDAEEQAPRLVAYNSALPIETFDVVIVDECHRSIYNLWRQVLEYFDAFLIGLTATPSKQTLGFFHNNLVSEYGHERAVADGVNVDYDVYRIRTQVTEGGSRVEAGHYVDKRDKMTRQQRWELLDEDLEYGASQLDRDVVAPDQIRTIIRTFRDRLFQEIFPGRSEVPKTLVFAKDDSHAEDIVHIIREEFGQGNDFCKKITYKTTGDKPDDLIAALRNNYYPRIAVTVDMISTGTDIKPLECLLFLRDVKSRVYFEQMKGRGTRTILPDDFQSVTPDAKAKTHFVIVDAVGVCETLKGDGKPLERKRTVPFDRLLQLVALGQRDEDTLSSLASRLARLDQKMSEADRQDVQEAAGGLRLGEIVNDLLDALDPDVQTERAQALYRVEEPSDEQRRQAAAELAEHATRPFDEPTLRETLVAVQRRSEQTIDTVTQDVLLAAGYDAGAKERAQALVSSFRQFIEENKDELAALQILYSRPYGQRQLTYAHVKELARAIERPPYSLTAEALWQAYEQLEAARVRGAGPQKLLTNLVSLLRYALGQTETLEPFPTVVQERYEAWLAGQRVAGREFTPEQIAWLEMIRDHVAASLAVTLEDFEYAPFYEKGGVMRAYRLFGEELTGLVEQMNEVLAA